MNKLETLQIEINTLRSINCDINAKIKECDKFISLIAEAESKARLIKLDAMQAAANGCPNGNCPDD